MKYWRIKFKFNSLQITPWQSDTIFGSLCWAYLHRHGEEKLSEFLKPFNDGTPSFLLSDIFPSGYYPIPITSKLPENKPNLSSEEYQSLKERKKATLISEEDCSSVWNNNSFPQHSTTENGWIQHGQLHASINRLTGTTTKCEDEGSMSLYYTTGNVPIDNNSFQLLIAEREHNCIETVYSLLKDIEKTGFGKKKSSGMGSFNLVDEPQTWNPPTLNQPANGFVCFSSFVPAKHDPISGFWSTRIKYGKLGERYAVEGSPFKTPWMVLETGSTFYTQSEPKEFYGKMLFNLSERYPEVVQYAYAFPVPIVLSDETANLMKQ